jgi:hypothetical protein
MINGRRGSASLSTKQKINVFCFLLAFFFRAGRILWYMFGEDNRFDDEYNRKEMRRGYLVVFYFHHSSLSLPRGSE